MNFARQLILSFALLLPAARAIGADDLTTAESTFHAGVAAYKTADFTQASTDFQKSAEKKPAVGTYQNLGDAEWQRGRMGPAILAWEQALWISPADAAARNDLQFARTFGQIDSPELTWYEVVSTWMPSGGWALVSALAIWLIALMLALPGILRRRRTGGQQALAAIGLTVLLLTVPAHIGWHTRSRLGVVLEANTLLRLTPTETADEITRVGAGEPGRCERAFGNYYFIRFRNTAGWLTRDEFALVSGK